MRLAAAILLCATPALAHFRLADPPSPSPPSFDMQDSQGTPLLSAPCGQADPGNPAVPSNLTSTLAAGSTVSITFTETIPHPGWYRVLIAANQAALPADPVVTPGSTPCGTTPIDPNPTLPLLADGVLVHTAAFSGPQTMNIPLPAGMTCTNCVLQVVEFMQDHPLNNPGGCFYHHCMNVSVTAAGPQDAGTVGAGADASPVATPASTSGCCDARGGDATALVTGVLAGLMLLRRRR